MVKSGDSKRALLLMMMAATLLPLLSEAFMHHPGMYGGNHYGNESSSTRAAPKTQAEKLRDPWLWVAVIAFSGCMWYCLKISMEGRWKECCGGGNDGDQYQQPDPYQSSGGGFVVRRGNMAGFGRR